MANLLSKRALLIFVSLGVALAQQPKTVSFYEVSFVKTKPDKGSAYRSFLKTNAPLLQAGVKDGRWMSYGGAQVVTPTGTAQEHDFMLFAGFERFEQMEPSDVLPDSMKAALTTLGYASQEDYTAKRGALRDVVRSEWWKREAGTTVTADSLPKIGEYLVVTYLKMAPDKTKDYLAVWKKFSLPLQEERIKMGKLKSYSLCSVTGGAGTDAKYSMVSIVRYGSFKDLAPADDAAAQNDALADRVHPGQDWRQWQRDMVSMRTVFRTELLRIEQSIR